MHQKKFRSLYGAYLAEGPKIVEEVMLMHEGQLEYVVALPEWLAGHGLRAGGKWLEASAGELERISALTTPNEVLAVLKVDPAAPPPVPGAAWSLALDGIQDPGNLGTILRIADWFGLRHVVCSGDCAEVYNPKVIQASMGSFLRIYTHYVDLGAWLADYAGPVYAATLHGEPVNALGKAPPGVVLIGNESKGIRVPLPGRRTQPVTIPRLGQAESLNAAVAAGILLSRLCTP